ncbi:MAG: hypothetical protein JO235_18825 [Chroococcidiopsidaceae cyanobacterium CP_BM_RX_35]|nr:hypothetical protein [Chroococcidiopsidaceae cyanobacterium CP_BM_RX_35]
MKVTVLAATAVSTEPLQQPTQGFAGGGSGAADKGEAFSVARGGRLRADDKACGQPAGNVLENGGTREPRPNRLDFLKQALTPTSRCSQMGETDVLLNTIRSSPIQHQLKLDSRYRTIKNILLCYWR